MAKWSSGWKWSDGTKWASGFAAIQLFTSLIDRIFYYCSLKITQVATSGSTSAPVIASLVAEVGPRTQLPNRYEAFIDRNGMTQRISARVDQTFDTVSTIELTTESGEILITEDAESIVLGLIAGFTIDRIHILANQRSRSQPSG